MFGGWVVTVFTELQPLYSRNYAISTSDLPCARYVLDNHHRAIDGVTSAESDVTICNTPQEFLVSHRIEMRRIAIIKPPFDTGPF